MRDPILADFIIQWEVRQNCLDTLWTDDLRLSHVKNIKNDQQSLLETAACEPQEEFQPFIMVDFVIARRVDLFENTSENDLGQIEKEP